MAQFIRTKIETASNQAKSVCIKLIHAEGMVKALVLDMSRTDDRLLYIGQGADAREAHQDAMDFVDSFGRSGQGWH